MLGATGIRGRELMLRALRQSCYGAQVIASEREALEKA